MPGNVPWDDVPKPGSSFEVGIFYTMVIEEAELTHSKGGKSMAKIMFRCTGPDDAEGGICYENYTLGSDNDKEAEDPETLKKSMGMRFLKEALVNAQVKLNASIEKTLERAKGKALQIVFKAEKDSQTDELRTRPGSYYPDGTAKPGTAKGGKKPAAATAPERKAKPPADDDDDALPPAKGASKPKAAPAKAADYADDDD